MKLKSDFVTHTIEDTQFLLSVGGKSFNGIVGNNETAAFIIDRLQNDVTKEEIVDAMLEEYDADRETVQKDVERILDTLRKINAIEEYSLNSADRSDAASEAPVDMKTTTFEELLRRDGKLVYQVKGSSMTPMLRERKDIVVISAVSGRLRKNDVALYRIGNNYVLHRVIKARSDSYVLRGDANYLSETIPIRGSAAACSRTAGGGPRGEHFFQRKRSLYRTLLSSESRCGRLTEPRYNYMPAAP